MKKLLSILMAVALLASVFTVPASAFVPEKEPVVGFKFVQDFSDESITDFTLGYGEPGVTAKATIVDGKAVYVPNPKNNAMTLVSDYEVSTAKYVVEFETASDIII